MKIIIGVVIVIIAVAIIGFYLSTAEVTLAADDAQITLPSNYTVKDKIIASSGDTNISFVPQKGTSSDKDFENKFFGAIKSNGKAAGYKNVTNKTINGYTVHEFAANPNKLKNVSTDHKDTSEGVAWTTYPPETVAYFDDPVDHFRNVNYIKGDNVYTLKIYTSNPDTNLYTPEIEKIINSIAPVEK